MGAPGAEVQHGRRAGTAAGAELGQGGEAMDTLLQQLCEMLGLGDDSSPEEVLAAVRALNESAHGDEDEGGERDGAQGDDRDGDRDAGAMQAAGAGAGADPARYVAVAQFQRVLGELNQLRVERARERAERAVDDAIKAGKLIPAQRQWAISYCQADFKGFRRDGRADGHRDRDLCAARLEPRRLPRAQALGPERFSAAQPRQRLDRTRAPRPYRHRHDLKR